MWRLLIYSETSAGTQSCFSPDICLSILRRKPDPIHPHLNGSLRSRRLICSLMEMNWSGELQSSCTRANPVRRRDLWSLAISGVINFTHRDCINTASSACSQNEDILVWEEGKTTDAKHLLFVKGFLSNWCSMTFYLSTQLRAWTVPRSLEHPDVLHSLSRDYRHLT